MPQKLLYFFQLRKQFFFGLKFRGVDTAAAAPQSHWMLEMEHLVIHDVLDGGAGHPRMVEDTTDDDGIMRGIVMAKAVASAIAAPCHLRPSQQAMEESYIEIFK